LTKEKISKSPNAPNFSEEKIRKNFGKIFLFFERMSDCLIFRRMRHVSCAIYFLSLRIIDINIAIQDLLEWISQDPVFSQMMYYSVSRLNREIVEDFFYRFQRLLLYYKSNTKTVVKNLKRHCEFLSQSMKEVEF